MQVYTIDENVSLRVSPNWVGTWSTDTKCDKSTCCCLFDYITTAALEDGTKLRMIGNTEGTGVCAGKAVLFTTFDMPKDFILPYRLVGVYPVNFSLSEDSQVISVISQAGSQCNTIATRLKNGAISVDSMQLICHILLLVVCVDTFVDCKGGRGSIGGGARYGGARYGGAGYSAAGYSGTRYSGSHQKESKSCNTDQCQSERAIFGTIFFIGAPSIIFVLIVLCILCCKSDDRTNEKIDQHTNTTKYKGNCESNLQANKKVIVMAHLMLIPLIQTH
ncbi:unnamed protein product [Adineta steineri]|uniref:Uncharacterized protein n=2 Tax=Adineta steineri TaxID=433720 RepID=A0A814GJZ4_9BILA|nr:unnamed protein product [Adineta steineri]